MSLNISMLDAFKHITLDDIKTVKLLNRVDTKFVFEVSKVEALLKKLKNDYDVLKINNEVAVAYESQYFDTNELLSFSEHQRGKGNRFKIRMRKYISSKLSFLEVKMKIKGRTVKERIKINDLNKTLSEPQKDFVQKHLNDITLDLKPSLSVYYRRITLVNKDKSERITLDINLTYNRETENMVLGDIIIAELKQKKLSRTSLFYLTAKKLQIRNVRVSKYCTGIIMTRKGLKYNRFKEKLIYLNKLSNGYIARNIAA